MPLAVEKTPVLLRLCAIWLESSMMLIIVYLLLILLNLYDLEKHPDVEFEFPRDKNGKVITMWNLIPTKTMPPTRLVRYCCQYLKENGGEGRDKITGVRWDESVRRRKKRSGLEVEDKKDRTKLDPDNMDDDMVRFCMQSKGFILNPIIDWTTDEVWEFIHRFNIPYCELYDQGFKRLGCIGCPMATLKEKKREFDRYPKFKEAYIRAFDRMIQHQIEGGGVPERQTEELFKWWAIYH